MRNIDWQQKLSNYLKECQNASFVWGELDCCLFAANCAVLVCNKDPAQPYRGTYSSELGAKKALLLNHKSFAKAFGATFEEIPPSLAQRGDIVMFSGELGETAGVMWAGRIWAMSRTGLVVVNSPILQAWRVE